MPSRIQDTPKKTTTTGAAGSTPLPTGTLKSGASGDAVKQLQAALVKVGVMTKEQAATGPGKFGPLTRTALQEFQAKWSLEADGVYGPKTRAAITDALAGKKPPAPPKPPANNEVKGLFYGDAFKGQVAITFDDGPNPVNTPKVLDILKKHGVKATFFVTGDNATKYPELIRRIVAEGHTLGNHSWDHANLSKLGPAAIRSEVQRTQDAVDKALGRHYEITQFRPPYGAMSQDVKDVARENQDATVLWNVDSNDWKYPKDDQAILQNVFDGANSVYARGGVILFHDIHPQSVRVLDGVISRLQKEGFDIQKTDVLLGEKYGKKK